jgi:hypothetical protein
MMKIDLWNEDGSFLRTLLPEDIDENTWSGDRPVIVPTYGERGIEYQDFVRTGTVNLIPQFTATGPKRRTL